MKKTISILVVVSILLSMFSIGAYAETVTGAGFYSIGTMPNVVITPESSSQTVQKVLADIDGNGTNEELYINSDKLSVDLKLAREGAYYGIVLVEGEGTPTKSSDIYYIDQLSTDTGSIVFDVFPILPTERKTMTLYISCSEKNDDGDYELLSAKQNYTPQETFNVATQAPTPTPTPTPPDTPDTPTYPKGDVNNDGIWDVTDALMALRIGADLYPAATSAEKVAADVNEDGNWNVTDALKILQYGAGLINSWR